MSRHYVLCWELGSDLGHVSQLATIASGLRQRGHRVSVVLKDLNHARRYFGALDVPWYQAPQPPGPHHREIPLNHADMLYTNGYDDPEHLAGMLQAWRNLLRLLQPDWVVAEAAPTAALAAHCNALACVRLDNGFFAPPPGHPMPALRDWQPVPAAELEAREERVLQTLNQALLRLSLSPLPSLSQLFDLRTYWLTWPELNHFGAHSPERHLGPLYTDTPGVSLDWPAGEGRKVVAYLKPDHPQAMATLEWSLRHGNRLVAYLPRWPAQALRRLQAMGSIHISAEPLDLRPLLEDCAWVICHGGVGTVSRTLRAGKPLLLLPSHVEQQRTARALMGLRLGSLVRQQGTRLLIDADELERARARAQSYAVRLGSAESSLARLLDVLEER